MTTTCQHCPLYRIQLEESQREIRRWTLPRYVRFCRKLQREGECLNTKAPKREDG